MTGRISLFFYGLASYSFFFATFLYSIGFVGNRFVPKTIDSGATVSFDQALFTDLLLLTLFGLQHSIMARGAFKRWWGRFMPAPAERSTYILASSLMTIFVYWKWQPLAMAVWNTESKTSCFILTSLFWAGWALVVFSSFLVSHFDLFGLRQVYLHMRGRRHADIGFKMPSLYKIVRHPIMLGYLIAFWSAPRMTVGHLVFALFMTLYIVIGVKLEERDLVSTHGTAYEEYRRRVPMLPPFPKNK